MRSPGKLMAGEINGAGCFGLHTNGFHLKRWQAISTVAFRASKSERMAGGDTELRGDWGKEGAGGSSGDRRTEMD